MAFKSKVLLLKLSRYNLDNGVRGGKVLWTSLAVTQSENSKGLEVLTASCPFEVYDSIPASVCVAEIEWTLKASKSNGKDTTQVTVLSAKILPDKSFTGTAGEFKLKD